MCRFICNVSGDGKKLSFQADEYNIDNLVSMVNKHAKKLEEMEQANA
jgi:hypothetical protein